MTGLTTDKMAQKARVSVDTVSFYERRSLIAEPARTPSNYRIYPEEESRRLSNPQAVSTFFSHPWEVRS